jgi:hypothetical protein
MHDVRPPQCPVQSWPLTMGCTPLEAALSCFSLDFIPCRHISTSFITPFMCANSWCSF